jgi:DNA repair photolyase
MSKPGPPAVTKGRGSASNHEGRFESLRIEAEDDGWYQDAVAEAARPKTVVHAERARSIISRNQSPDIPFDQSINPYRGCEHGCIYCYARPSHAYLNHSAGMDFETQLYAKTNAVDVLRAELGRRGYQPATINLGANTDPYQPIERQQRLTRGLLEVLVETRHPFTVITKNAMVERDVDLLAEAAALDLVQVFISVTTLDNRLASRLEPRASAPHRRIKAIAALHQAGIPVGVFVAPLIPMLTDKDLEAILELCHGAGASTASYTLVRLPHEVAPLFREWLQLHVPQRAQHIMSLIQQMRGGKDYDANFRTRMRGEGVFADLISRRFRLACQRLGILRRNEEVSLRSDLFRPPRLNTQQGDLF